MEKVAPYARADEGLSSRAQGRSTAAQACVRHILKEVHMSKVVEVSTVIPCHWSAVPTHFDLTGRDGSDRIHSDGWQPTSPIQTTRSPDASLRASAVFMIPQ